MKDPQLVDQRACSLWQDDWQGSLNCDRMHITKQQSGLLKMQ